MLGGLPSIPELSQKEVLHFLEAHRLSGHGLGWIDVHLLASATLADMPLFTLDAQLAAAHTRVGR